jgi:hypothetical protein
VCAEHKHDLSKAPFGNSFQLNNPTKMSAIPIPMNGESMRNTMAILSFKSSDTITFQNESASRTATTMIATHKSGRAMHRRSISASVIFRLTLRTSFHWGVACSTVFAENNNEIFRIDHRDLHENLKPLRACWFLSTTSALPLRQQQRFRRRSSVHGSRRLRQ